MSGESRRARRSVAVTVAGLVMASGWLAGVSSARAEPSTADIQWAQTILKDKGFDIGGRANGQMTAQTRAALGSYQKSVGLPASGQLDPATVSRMMGDREKKAVPTMGSLSKSQIGQTPREREVVPRAAPTQRIDSGNETIGGIAQFGSAPPASSASSSSSSTSSSSSSSGSAAPAPHAVPAPASAVRSTPSSSSTVASAIPSPVPPRSPSAAASTATDGPSPQAAPRGAVTAATPGGAPAPLVEPAAGGGMPGWLTGLLRYGVMGLLAATLGGIGFAWWRSGRGAVPAGLPTDETSRETRREPSFGGANRREELTTGPRLTAERR